MTLSGITCIGTTASARFLAASDRLTRSESFLSSYAYYWAKEIDVARKQEKAMSSSFDLGTLRALEVAEPIEDMW